MNLASIILAMGGLGFGLAAANGIAVTVGEWTRLDGEHREAHGMLCALLGAMCAIFLGASHMVGSL